MALVNHAKKEIHAKIVYFGSPGIGKRTAINHIFSRIRPSLRGEIKSIPAGGDNLLFFDFTPFKETPQDGYRVRLHVYTLTGSVINPAIWKMMLKGADGIIVMADASPERISDVQQSICRLQEFMSAYGIGIHDTSVVLQLNRFKREPVNIDCEQLVSSMDLTGLPCRSACAATGEGLLESFSELSRLVLDRIAEKGLKW